MRLSKLAHRYKELAAEATLVLQSYFTMPLPAENWFIEFKGWCPLRFKKKKTAAKCQSKSFAF
jgi:hypothetical protein